LRGALRSASPKAAALSGPSITVQSTMVCCEKAPPHST
jgi:hypothetical protein